MIDLSLHGMLKDGYTKKMADYFYKLIEHEKACGLWSVEELEWAHSKGFLAESVVAYNLTDENINSYLSDYDYFRIWPLNSWERIWINDKLTMKHVFYGTDWDKYIPEYYYYKTEKALSPLMNCPSECISASRTSLCTLLKLKKNLACKPCNGSLSKGFVQLSYENNNYYANGKELSELDIEKFIKEHNNYIYTEFLIPEKEMAEIFPLIHTIRVLVINADGNEPKIAGAYLRFGTKSSGYANYTNCSESVEFVYDVNIDIENGKYYGGKMVFADHVISSPNHPDTNTLAEGKIDCWDEIKAAVIGMAKHINQCEYLGFDVCVTDKGVKVMEINSHSGIKHIQITRPLLQGWTREYYLDKIREINYMTEEQKTNRNNILR